ncbi:hypothetical protein VUR80DRAFT_1668 [Thermomyces stellatus]
MPPHPRGRLPFVLCDVSDPREHTDIMNTPHHSDGQSSRFGLSPSTITAPACNYSGLAGGSGSGNQTRTRLVDDGREADTHASRSPFRGEPRRGDRHAHRARRRRTTKGFTGNDFIPGDVPKLKYKAAAAAPAAQQATEVPRHEYHTLTSTRMSGEVGAPLHLYVVQICDTGPLALSRTC